MALKSHVPDEPRPLRAIFYSALSGEEAVEGEGQFGGTDAHMQRLRRKGRERNYVCVEEIMDIDHSGSAMRGPGLEKALQMLERDEADVLFAIRPDRVGRGSAEAEVRRRLLRAGKDWDFADVPAPPLRARTASDKFVRGVLQLASGKETWDAAERAWQRAHEAWLSGLWIGAPPFAYRIRTTEQDSGTLAKLLTPEADEVAEFTWLADKLLETGSVARTLKAAQLEGMRPRRRHRKALKSGGSAWTQDTLTSMLRSRCYIGETRFTFACYTQLEAEEMARLESTAEVMKRRPAKYELVDMSDEPRRWGCVRWRKGKHEPLLTFDKWQDVQRVLDECSGELGRGRRIDAPVRILAGHINCGRCDIIWTDEDGVVRRRPLPFVVKPSGKRKPSGEFYPYYARSDKLRATPGIEVLQHDQEYAGATNVNAEAVENWLMEYFDSLARADDHWAMVRGFIEERRDGAIVSLNTERETLNATLTAHLAEQSEFKSRYEALLLKGNLGDEARDLFEQKLTYLRREISLTEEAIDELEGLAIFFNSIPAELDVLRAKLWRAVQYWDNKALGPLRTLLNQILPPNGGVRVYGARDFECELRLSERLDSEEARFRASKFVLKEEWRGIPTVRPQLLREVCDRLNTFQSTAV